MLGDFVDLSSEVLETPTFQGWLSHLSRSHQRFCHIVCLTLPSRLRRPSSTEIWSNAPSSRPVYRDANIADVCSSRLRWTSFLKHVPPPTAAWAHTVESYCCPVGSDGRVSEPTTLLIRRLLLLDPRQRITADQVLERYFSRHNSLLRLMHSLYVAPRDAAADDQVVPQLAPAAPARRTPHLHPPGASLENKVNQLQLMESKLFTVSERESDAEEEPDTGEEPAPAANPLLALSRHGVLEHIDGVLQRAERL